MNLQMSHLIPFQAWVLLYQSKTEITSNELTDAQLDTTPGLGTAVPEQITDNIKWTYGWPTWYHSRLGYYCTRANHRQRQIYLPVSHLIPFQGWVLLHQDKSQITANELTGVPPDTIPDLSTAVPEPLKIGRSIRSTEPKQNPSPYQI